MSEIFTSADITNSDTKGIVNILINDIDESHVLILTRDEFLGKIKAWLRTMPGDERQMIIDELVACTLRTLE